MSKLFDLEFGPEVLHLRLPEAAEIIALPEAPALPDPARAVRAALERPLGSPPLAELARRARARHGDPAAVIVVSDNTRPTPYRGPESILEPILDILRSAGIARIDILVATGTHRALAEAELRALLPEGAFAPGVAVHNHDGRDPAQLRRLGRTPRGTEAWINRRYLDADLKILTGLAEPHFMAGVSGGPKAICPGIAGEEVTHTFHGAAMMADPRACSLRLDGNPCHAESAAVADMAGADFIVNATINRRRRLTGVFAGELRAAHRAACARVLAEAGLPLAHEYDLVVTHAGVTGVNHYQAAKAGVEAVRAVRRGGVLVLAANHTDADPVGGARYRRVLPLLRELGPDAFEQRVLAPDWTFIPEQWEVQMWGRVFRKLGPEGRLVYCAPRLTGAAFAEPGLPGEDGGAGLAGLAGRDLAEAMVQRALDRSGSGRTAVLADGPYGVPVLNA